MAAKKGGISAPGPSRATKGTIGAALLVRLSAEMHEAVSVAAEMANVSASEWVRQAVETKLSVKKRARRTPQGGEK